MATPSNYQITTARDAIFNTLENYDQRGRWIVKKSGLKICVITPEITKVEQYLIELSKLKNAVFKAIKSEECLNFAGSPCLKIVFDVIA